MLRVWWSLGGAVLFWAVELAYGAVCGLERFWPTGWTAVGFAAGAGGITWVLTYFFGPWRPGGFAWWESVQREAREGRPPMWRAERTA